MAAGMQKVPSGGSAFGQPDIRNLNPDLRRGTRPVPLKVDCRSGVDSTDLGQRYRNPPTASLTLRKPLVELEDGDLSTFLRDTVREHFGDYAQRGVRDQVQAGAKPRAAVEAGLRNIDRKLDLLENSPYAALRILLPVYHRLKSERWSQAPVGPNDRRPDAGRHLQVPIHGDLTPSNLLVQTFDGQPVIETHDYDEAMIHGPRSIDLERGAASLFLAATSLEVAAGGPESTQAQWAAVMRRLDPGHGDRDGATRADDPDEALDAALRDRLSRAAEAEGEPLDPAEHLDPSDLSAGERARLAHHVAEVRRPIGLEAVHAFARAYQEGMTYFVEHPEATEFPWTERLGDDLSWVAEALSPIFGKSAKRTPEKQLSKWVDGEVTRFKGDHDKLEPAHEEVEAWQSVLDELKAEGRFPEDAVVHDVAHRLLSGGGSLGIYKRYLLVETGGELQLWQAKEPTASSAEAHAPLNMVDVRAGGGRKTSDLNDALRSIDIKAIHHGTDDTGERAVRFDGLDHILSRREPTRVTFDADRVAADQVPATAFLLGIEAARAHALGWAHQNPRSDRGRLLQGIQGDGFADWLGGVAQEDAAFIRRAHRLLRQDMDPLRDAIFKHAQLPALRARVDRRERKHRKAETAVDEARRDGAPKKRLKALKKALDEAERKLVRARQQLQDAETISRSTDPARRVRA
ncbi:MAG TPA: DUF2252 family protein [Myxococcales bacterium LLY-WYZ-16_1]|nr:DUF2252 family protein [Myxococcales bacterium LLY-WYZ-16_1]